MYTYFVIFYKHLYLTSLLSCLSRGSFQNHILFNAVQDLPELLKYSVYGLKISCSSYYEVYGVLPNLIR